jgi:hypothetical protein
MTMNSDEILNELANIEREAYWNFKAAEKAHAEAKKALCDEIESRGLTSVDWNGTIITRVASERVKIDQGKFKSAVPADIWQQCVVEKIDQVKVRQLIVDGKISKETIDEAVKIVESAPYLRYAFGAESEEEN